MPCSRSCLSLSRRPGSINMRSMVIDMNDEQLKTLADLQEFLKGTVMMDFAVEGDERYEFIARTVKRFGYRRRSDCGVKNRSRSGPNGRIAATGLR